MKALTVLKYIGFGILGVGFVILAVFLVMLLWNWLIPELFNGPEINFWQTAGLFILSKILLTGMPGDSSGRRSRRDWRRKYHGKYSHCYPEDEKITAPGQV
jgi:hypothetical protein